MSSEKAISVNEVSKCYQIYDKPQNRLKQALFRGRKQYFREFWALHNISFDVPKGQTIGIVGRNGSGKSTILQIIAKTLTATAGTVNVNGRVSALLELGSGFNPDFTGRENVIMSCTIMGLNRREIEERMPLIEKFADIGDFIDQSVKMYSSGMYVRLAFACAINVDPDIIIIDEALAVGDMQFQLKCLDKLKSFQALGKTVLFVSHDSYAVRNFCDHVIWMDKGTIRMQGDAVSVIEKYQDFMKVGAESESGVLPQETNRNGNVLTIDKVQFVDHKGQEVSEMSFGQLFDVVVEYTLHQPLEGVVGGIAIYDQQKTYICGLNTKLDKKELPDQPGKYALRLVYENMNLQPGTYDVHIGFYESAAVVPLDYRSRMDKFIINAGDYFAEGLVFFPHNWTCRGIE
jgi:teichoic acid transport system ATP-binding protein